MNELNPVWTLYSLAFVLGLRHGFDADHLVAVDGLVRRNTHCRPRLARVSGLLFSAGHGSVVVAAALAATYFAAGWQPPSWMEYSGSLISVGLLVSLAFLNLQTLMKRSVDIVIPKGLRGSLLNRLIRAEHPLSIILIGVFFAFAFDTLFQAALFAGFAVRYGESLHALFAALLYTGGMMLTDGVNGYLITLLARYADRAAIFVSRLMTATIVVLSLALGLGIASGLVFSPAAEWMDENAFWISAGVVAATLVVYSVMIAAIHQARKSEPQY